jgi:hypothetical protein
METQKGPLQRAKEILTARGLTPSDYKHLSYDQILKLAGLKQ